MLTLAPDRVAMFSYAHVPWLQQAAGRVCRRICPKAGRNSRFSAPGSKDFSARDIVYIGMDHFARPDDELAIAQRNRTLHRNFQGYTTKAGADLYGMGVSAISSIGDAYAQNRREVPAYQTAVTERGIATMRGYRLSADDRLRRAVIGRLLCHTVIPKREIEREFSISFDEYFAAELARLEEPSRRRAGESDARRNSRHAARPHLHSQRRHGFRPLSRGTENGPEAAVSRRLSERAGEMPTEHARSSSSAEESQAWRAPIGCGSSAYR